MALFAQPTQDENLVLGWNSQEQSLGYGSTEAAVTAAYGPGQPGAGTPQPPGAFNANPSENSASYTQSILSNPGYADGTGHAQTTVTAPAVPASGSVAANPTNLTASVTITGGDTSAVVTGGPGATYAQAAQAGTGDGTYAVPPQGVIGLTYTTAPDWTWDV